MRSTLAFGFHQNPLDLTNNIGICDRQLRTIGVIAVSIGLAFGQASAPAAGLLGGLILLLYYTSFAGWCPVYRVLGISTLSQNN